MGKIVQSDTVITAIDNSTPVIAEENLSGTSAAAIIANFLRTGSPSVQYILRRPDIREGVTQVNELLNALSLEREIFYGDLDSTDRIVTFTLKVK
jgi:hypothetical protein